MVARTHLARGPRAAWHGLIRVVRTAFGLGAGLGTRLRPLTARRPKPLIPVVNRPLIAHTFDRLLAESIESLVVNTHWAAEAYATAFPDGSYRGVPLDFREEKPGVMETAGGIKNVADLLGVAAWPAVDMYLITCVIYFDWVGERGVGRL